MIPNVRSIVAAGVCALALLACGGDDTAATTTTAPPSTTTAPTTSTTVVTTTIATTSPTTVAPTQPPTTPVPTTTVEELQAQIQADLQAGRDRQMALQMQPTLEGLEEVIATFALHGSEYYEQQLAYAQDLVRLGDVVVLGEPPVNSVVVEDVTFDGPEPHIEATVKICDSYNVGRITPAANSPIGQDIVVIDAELASYRYSIHVVRTDAGWIRDTVSPSNVDAAFPGAATCG